MKLRAQKSLKTAAKYLGWKVETLLEIAARGRIQPLVYLRYQTAVAGEMKIPTAEEVKDLERYEKLGMGVFSVGEVNFFVPLPPPSETDRFYLSQRYWELILSGKEEIEVISTTVAHHHHLPPSKSGYQWNVNFEQPFPVVTLDDLFFLSSELDKLKAPTQKFDAFEELLERIYKAKPEFTNLEIWEALLNDFSKGKRKFDVDMILQKVEPPSGPKKLRKFFWKASLGQKKLRSASYNTFKNKMTKVKAKDK